MSQLKICPQCGTEYELDQRFCPRDGSTLRLQGGTTDLVGTIIADRYHVLKKLGEGGMGQVYLAEHVKMGRRSAVKVMNPGMVNDADAISRFNREAANASRINHPNVAAVYDFGETSDGLIYLAMEFIEGPSLTKLIEEQGALPPLRAADITRQASEALTIAHDMGIVHRDLKPDNIMLARTRDGGDLVKVVDFGIAKAADNAAQKVTKTGLVVGTPEYMSPEQLAGDKLDGRSDIYSLALVAFNMLTGHLPFPAETVQESMIMRLTDLPKRLGEMKPDVAWTSEVQAVLDRALEREAGKRYQSASEFGRDLFRAIEKMPLSQVAAMGTQVIEPVRAGVAGGGERAAAPGGATAIVSAPPAVPATRVAAADDLAGAAAALMPPPRRSKTMLAAAAVAIVVIGGAGAAMLTTRGSGKAPETPVRTQGAALPLAQNAGGPGSTQSAARQPPPNEAGRAASPASSGERRTASRNATAPANAGGGGAPMDVEFALSKLEPLTDPEKGDKGTARKAISELDKLEPQIKTNQEDVHAKIIRAEAYLLLDEQGEACTVLKSIEGPSKTTTRAARVAALASVCS